MHLSAKVKPGELAEILLNVATVRPVFVLGQPGIGKSSLVEAFAQAVDLPCVSLLGTQLAAEDLIGVPQIVERDGQVRSRFAPPEMIARDEPYCLFLDELNGANSDVQKAFYSLILDKRIGDYHLPKGSVVIGAGNRSQDNAIVKTMSSALINRMVLIEMESSPKDWLRWATGNNIHPWVYDYIRSRPDHLTSAPPKVEQPFSTPRSWHMLSDLLHSTGEDISDTHMSVLSGGCLTPSHAASFKAFVKTIRHEWDLEKILKGDLSWPREAASSDVLLFLSQSLRARLVKELPKDKGGLGERTRELTHRSKDLISELADINQEVAQIVVSDDEDGDTLPNWYLTEVIRDLPRLAAKR